MAFFCYVGGHLGFLAIKKFLKGIFSELFICCLGWYSASNEPFSSFVQILSKFTFNSNGLFRVFTYVLRVCSITATLLFSVYWEKMSEFVIDDWKLKARTVVKLYRKNTNTLVSLLLKGDIVICSNVLFSCHKFFFSTVYLQCTEVKDLIWTKL